MLNEQASSSLEQPIWKREAYAEKKQDPFSELRSLVEQVMHIHAEHPAENDDNPREVGMLGAQNYMVISYDGSLFKNSEQAYAELDDLLKPLNKFAMFRAGEEHPHAIHIIHGRIQPVSGKPWINLVLFLLTLASVFYVGAQYGVAGILNDAPGRASEFLLDIPFAGTVISILHPAQIWRGYPYALSLMLILGAHELGHYFAARYHKHSVSLPYFIPLPFVALGTMGAVIRSREPMRNRKVLIDIGAAGPLAGMVFALPIVLIGLATSNVELVTGTALREGNSILYAVAKVLVLGQFYPTATHDVLMNQMALAGWLGLLVTALNLIPVGQLDGGHVLYSLLGNRARLMFYPVMGVMVLLTILSPNIWLIWVVLLFFLGQLYAPPLDDITPLDKPRRGVAIFTLIIFVLVFVPRPFTIFEGSTEPAPQSNAYSQPHQVETVSNLTLQR